MTTNTKVPVVGHTSPKWLMNGHLFVQPLRRGLRRSARKTLLAASGLFQLLEGRLGS